MMKNTFNISGVIILIPCSNLFKSCQNEEVHKLTSSAITNITGTTATSGGTIIDKGFGSVVERGICWSKAIKPTIAEYKTSEGEVMVHR